VDISSSVSTLVGGMDDAVKFTRVINFSSGPVRQGHPPTNGAYRSDGFHFAWRRPWVYLGLWLPKGTRILPRSWPRPMKQTAKLPPNWWTNCDASFDYYQSQEGATPVKELILSGKGTWCATWTLILAEAIELPWSLGIR